MSTDDDHLLGIGVHPAEDLRQVTAQLFGAENGCPPSTSGRGRAAAVAAVYERLRSLPGIDAAARALARAHGWPPAAAWDGEVFAIDDPAVPDVLAAATLGMPAALRRLRLAEHIAATRQAARRAELTPAHLARERRHAGSA